MRRACVLRQLRRCAESTSLPPPSSSSSQRWASRLAGCYGLLLQELRSRVVEGGEFDTHSSRPFTTSSPALALKAPWTVSPPVPPSVHPHPHAATTTTTFDALAAPEQFRSVMRLLPNSVVVCTSTGTGTGIGTESVVMPPCGMTMSSFTSLSLHPTPLITFNMATPSRTLDAVAQSRTFNIHVLSGDGEGARVAEWFRRGNSSELGLFEAGGMRDGCGCEDVQQGQEGRGAPLLRGKGVLYGIKCRLLDDEPHRGLVRVRDHVVVLAEVVDIVEGGRGEEKGQKNVFGLAYADRRYRQLGGTVVQEEDY